MNSSSSAFGGASALNAAGSLNFLQVRLLFAAGAIPRSVQRELGARRLV
jgi:hypothetical protein